MDEDWDQDQGQGSVSVGFFLSGPVLFGASGFWFVTVAFSTYPIGKVRLEGEEEVRPRGVVGLGVINTCARLLSPRHLHERYERVSHLFGCKYWELLVAPSFYLNVTCIFLSFLQLYPYLKVYSTQQKNKIQNYPSFTSQYSQKLIDIIIAANTM